MVSIVDLMVLHETTFFTEEGMFPLFTHLSDDYRLRHLVTHLSDDYRLHPLVNNVAIQI